MGIDGLRKPWPAWRLEIRLAGGMALEVSNKSRRWSQPGRLLRARPAGFVASQVDVDEPRLGIVADAAPLADDRFADVV